MNSRSSAIVSAIALICACSERTTILEGQAGTPFPVAAEDDREVPRAAVRLGECEGSPGGCSTYCTDSPEACASAAPGACQLALIDSASPFALVADGDQWDIERACFELRASPGLAVSATASDPASVARLRFRDAPTLFAPTTADDWGWEVGDERAPLQHAPVVVGGNLMSEFAVKLRDEISADAQDEGTLQVSFAKTFPGTEDELADSGSVYLKLQYPSRLSGGQLDDQCGFEGGTNCNLPEVSLSTGQFVSLLRPHRMAMDVCVAAPPCAPHYDYVAAGFDGAPSCRISPSATEVKECAEATDPQLGGKNATMIVATGIAGAALVEDSAERILGSLDDLPACEDLVPPISEAVRACVETRDGTFALPGWPKHTGLTVLRVRSFGVVEGTDDATGPGACQRLEERLRGLRSQCIETVSKNSVWAPPPLLDQSLTTGVVVLGEVSYAPSGSGPDPDRWIRAVILPPGLPFVNFTRVDSGTDAGQIDGFLGTALLQETETVLDYTEDQRPPALRMKCLRPGSGTCLSVPTCETAAKGDAMNGGAAAARCCHGLPQSLLAELIRPDGGSIEPAPRVEDRCCPALAPALRATLEQTYGVCVGQPQL